MQTFPNKDYNESYPIEFNFIDEIVIETISSSTITIDVSSGWDNRPGLVLVGPPIISGPKVIQQVQGGEPNTIYRITCTVVLSDGRVLVTPSYLPISGYINLYTENYLSNS